MQTFRIKPALLNTYLPKFVGTSFINKKIKAILPTKSLIYPIDSLPLPLLAHSHRQVFSIQQPRPLEPYKQVNDSVKISSPKTIIAPITKWLVIVTAPLDGLMSLQSQLRIKNDINGFSRMAMGKYNTASHSAYKLQIFQNLLSEYQAQYRRNSRTRTRSDIPSRRKKEEKPIAEELRYHNPIAVEVHPTRISKNSTSPDARHQHFEELK